VPGEPNGKNSNEGCGNAEEDLKYTVQLHDVSVNMLRIGGRWLVICMLIAEATVNGRYLAELDLVPRGHCNANRIRCNTTTEINDYRPSIWDISKIPNYVLTWNELCRTRTFRCKSCSSVHYHIKSKINEYGIYNSSIFKISASFEVVLSSKSDGMSHHHISGPADK
jgi:hypothetical protein